MHYSDEHYARVPNTPLAHYTNANGLAGILSTRTIWATNIRFLNDSREFLHAVDLAQCYLKDMPQINPTDSALKLQLQQSLESMHGTTWIASFSESSNLLSQWRGYCPNGGYSLVFDSAALSEIARRNYLLFSACIYDRIAQEKMIQELVDAAFEEFPEFSPSDPKYSPAGIGEKAVYFSAWWFFPKMLRIGSLVKDPAFHEEQEWRMVGGLYTPHIVPEYRIRGQIIVPHCVVRLDDEKSISEVIQEIIIGPGIDLQQAEIGLTFLKQSTGTGFISHRSSAVPFRSA
jgi:Protein of unknown function (DUF2971)